MLRECFCGEESWPVRGRTAEGGCPYILFRAEEERCSCTISDSQWEKLESCQKHAERTLRVKVPIPCSQPRSMMTNRRHGRFAWREFKIPILSRKREKDGPPYFYPYFQVYFHAYFFVGLSAGFSNRS